MIDQLNYSKESTTMISKLLEVFTTEYRRETEYREIAVKMLHDFLLKNESESVDVKVKRLKDKEFVSNFKLSAGEF